MTATQRRILDHMNDKNISAFHFDPDGRWVWKADIRRDAQLADRIVAFMPATFSL